MSKKYKIAWTDEIIALMGVIPDTEIAKMIGYNRNTVMRKRNSLGIKSPYWVGWTKENESKLGMMLDKYLADQLQCTIPTVQRKRKKMNISPFKR